MIEISDQGVEIYVTSGIICFDKYISPLKYYLVEEEFWPEEV